MPASIVAIAAQADRRLSSRYRHLQATKPSQVAVIAIARELIGFIWAIMKEAERLRPFRETSATT